MTTAPKTKEKTAHTPGQTTIHVEVEEEIAGVNLIPWVFYRHHRKWPNESHKRAWELITREDDWGIKTVWPKDNVGDLDWHKAFGERLLRVCSTRKFKTRVRRVEDFPNGTPRVVAVTVLWKQPVVNPLNRDTRGEWTLREMQCGKRNKIVSRFDGSLECDGEYLASELPEGTEDWEWECDGNSVVVFNAKDDDADQRYYEFRFQGKRQKAEGETA